MKGSQVGSRRADPDPPDADGMTARGIVIGKQVEGAGALRQAQCDNGTV